MTCIVPMINWTNCYGIIRSYWTNCCGIIRSYCNHISFSGLSWSWNNNYLCNRSLSPLKLWVRIPLRRGVLDTKLCDKVCQWLVTGHWFSPSTLVPSINKTDHHNITEILLKVVLSTKTLTYISFSNIVYIETCLIDTLSKTHFLLGIVSCCYLF